MAEIIFETWRLLETKFHLGTLVKFLGFERKFYGTRHKYMIYINQMQYEFYRLNIG